MSFEASDVVGLRRDLAIVIMRCDYEEPIRDRGFDGRWRWEEE